MKQWFCVFSILALLAFFNPVGLYAHKKADDHSVDSIPVKRDLAGKDAYIRYDSVRMEIINDNSGRDKTELIKVSDADSVILQYVTRIKLNTRFGVSNYGVVILNKYARSIIKSFKVTTFKPDGSKIMFDSTQIFHSSVVDPASSDNKAEITKYAIPGVEPGDEIEIRYECNLHGYIADNLYDNVLLNKDIPVMESCYKITVPYPYRLFYKCYNGFDEPVVEDSGTKVICTFSDDSIWDINDISHSSVFSEVPYFYYSVEFNKSIDQGIHWNNMYNEFEKYALPPINYTDQNDIELKKWIKKNLKDLEGKNKFQQFEELYTRLGKNLVKPSHALRENFNSTFLFSQNDPAYKFSICRPYVTLLRYLDIDYYACFAKNKFYGDIDADFIRRNEISDILLTYYDNDSNLVMVYPESRLFYMGEIPSFLNGTYAYMIKRASPSEKRGHLSKYAVSDDSGLVIDKIRIQKWKEKSNFLSRTRFIGVDLNSEKVSYKSDNTFSGFQSADNRFYFKDVFENRKSYVSYLQAAQNGRDVFRLDTLYLKSESSKNPFRFTYNMIGSLQKFYNHINDSTLLISIDDMLDNNRVEYSKGHRNLDIVLAYGYSDIQSIVIEFSQPVTVVNTEALAKNLANSTGSYNFDMTLLGDNKIKLTSTYVISKDVIDKSGMAELDAINDAAVEMANSRVIVRISK
jgi:hypothetical protein